MTTTFETHAPLEELLETASDQVLQMMRLGKNKQDILLYLVSIADELSGAESSASILVLDEEGLLRNGASPKLPPDYLAAIDRIRPDPNVGTCAAAAATGKIVITTDFFADEKWMELRQLPLGIGYKSAWSMPIKSWEGHVLGTFGTYFRECRAPNSKEQTGISVLAAAAALVLAKK
jgi:GAF domain-containing protein